MPANTVRRPWFHPACWFLLALAVRLAYLYEQGTTSVLFYQPLLDEQEMVHAARALLAGQGFGAEPLFKAPLYPALLAGVMAVSGDLWPWAIRLAQHVAGALLAALAFDAARRLTGGPRGRRAGALAAALVAFYPPLIRLEAQLVLDSLTVFLQSAMLWALLRQSQSARWRPAARRWALLVGALAALAVLNRPTLLPVLPFLALIIIWPEGRSGPKGHRSPSLGRRLTAAALFLAPVALALAGFALRNRIVAGEGLLLPWQGGYNLYEANREGANGKYLTQQAYTLTASGNPTRELAEAGYRQARHPAGPLRYSALNRFWMEEARRAITAHPGRWLGLMGRKGIYLWSNREIFNFEAYEVHKHLSRILRPLPLGFGILFTLALSGLAWPWPRRRMRRRGEFLFWAYTLLLGGAIALYFVSGRLRMPLAWPLACLAGRGWGSFGLNPAMFSAAGWWRRLNRPALTAALALGVLGATLSYGDWWGVRSESQRAIEYARLSNAAWRDGQPGRALDYVRQAAAEDPAYPTLALLRGQALYALGDSQGAATAFRESLTRLPQDPVAPYNLGIIAAEDPTQAAAALAWFSEALRRQPAYAQAAGMAALMHLRLGQTDLAARQLASYWPPQPAGAAAPLTVMIAACTLEEAQGRPAGAAQIRERLVRQYGPAGLRAFDEALRRPSPGASR